MRLPFFKVSFRGVRTHFTSLLVTVLAVALGTAFLTVLLALHHQNSSSVRASSEATAVSDVYVLAAKDPTTGQRPSLPLSLEKKISSETRVGSVHPLLEEGGALFEVTSDEAVPLPVTYLGGVEGSEWPKWEEGVPPTRTGDVGLETTAAKRLGLTVGDQVSVAYGPFNEDATISGISKYEVPITAEVLITLTPEAAGEYLQDLGTTRAFGVNLKQGADVEEVASHLASHLGTSVDVALQSEYVALTAGPAKAKSDIASLILFVFVVAALLASIFVISNTLRGSVLRQEKETQTLRLLGATKKQVLEIFAGQVLAAATVGGLVGALVGTWIAWTLSGPHPTWGCSIPTAAFMTGLAVTFVSAIPGAQALLAGPQTIAQFPSKGRASVGMGLSAVGLTGVLLGTLRIPTLPMIYLATGSVLLIFGVLALSPFLLQGLAHVLSQEKQNSGPSNVSQLLAVRDTKIHPKRGSAATAALILGVTLAVGGATVTNSYTASSTQLVKTQVTVNLIAEPTPPLTVLPEGTTNALKTVQGVKSVEDQVGFAALDLATGSGGGATSVKAWLAAPSYLGSSLSLPITEGTPFSGPTEIVVSKNFAKTHDLEVGDTVTLLQDATPDSESLGMEGPDAQGSEDVDEDALGADLQVVGIAEHLLGSTQIAGTPNLIELSGRAAQFPAFALITVDNPGQLETTLAELRSSAIALPAVNVTPVEGFTLFEGRVHVADLALLVVLGFAGLAALLSVASALGLSAMERTVQFKLLDTLGLDKRNIRQVVTGEAWMLSLYATTLGTVLGLFLGWTVQHYLKNEGWQVHVFPWQMVLGVYAGAAFIALVAPRLGATRIAVAEGG